MSQPGRQVIARHVFSNISTCKGKQAMKMNQLIECNMRNIFFLKSHMQHKLEKLFPGHEGY